MYNSNKDPSKITYKSRLIWRTGHGDEKVVSKEGRNYCIIPCKGSHTEPFFLSFIEKKENQKALWDYFLMASDDAVGASDRKLDVVGFKCFSSNDACDDCHEALLDLQTEHEEKLKFLPPEAEVKARHVPFLMLYHAKSFYNPQNDKIYGSSLYFFPVNIRPLIKLSRASGDGSYECIVRAKGAQGTDEIGHEDEVSFEDQEQFTYIVIKIAEGAPLNVTLQ